MLAVTFTQQAPFLNFLSHHLSFCIVLFVFSHSIHRNVFHFQMDKKEETRSKPMLQELEPITPHQRLGAKSHLLSRCAEHSSRYFQKAEMGPELESVPANIQPMGPHGDRSLCYTTEHKMLLLLSQNPRLRCTNIPMEILSGLSLSSPTKANFSRTSLRNVDSNKWPCKSWIPPLLYLSLPYHHWQCRIFSSRA